MSGPVGVAFHPASGARIDGAYRKGTMVMQFSTGQTFTHRLEPTHSASMTW
jgi:hypothetical protein